MIHTEVKEQTGSWLSSSTIMLSGIKFRLLASATHAFSNQAISLALNRDL